MKFATEAIGDSGLIILVAGLGSFSIVWICVILHEIHLDLARIYAVLAAKQLEIPSPLRIEVKK